MNITGKYVEDDNFTTIFSENTIYTIARNTGEWGCVSVGGRTPMGVLTQEAYNRLEGRCADIGTFTLD